MKLLEERIVADAIVGEGDVLKVGSFLNQNIDIDLLDACANEFYRLFKDEGITKVLTIEASGIAAATLTALKFGVPVAFAKKSATSNVVGAVYCAEAYSYTHKKNNNILLPCSYLTDSDKVLIIDDFLARGAALNAMITICEAAGAKVAGVGILVEKTYQGGGDAVRKKGIKLESLARVASLDVENGVTFAK